MVVMKQPSIVRKALGIFFLLGLVGVSSLQASFPAGSNTFATAAVIPPGETSGLPTTISAFTSEGGEPIHRTGGVGNSAGKTAWWTWTAPATGYCTMDTQRTLTSDNPVRRTLLAVYTGNAVNALTLVVAGAGYGSPSPLGDLSQVSFYAIQGTQYRIAVDGASAGDIDGSSYVVMLRLRLLELKKTGRITVFAYDTTVSGVGMATLEMTATGKLSGKLLIGTKTYPFAGYFGPDGRFQAVIPSKVPGSLPINLFIEGTGDGVLQVTNGSEGQFVSAFPRKVVFNDVNPNSTTGQFTGYMKHSSETDPGGQGFLTMKVAANGGIKAAGCAPDGTAVTFSSALCEYSSASTYYVIGYRPLLGGKSVFVLAGLLKETGADDRLNGGGGLYLRNAVPGATFYPAGFVQGFTVEGGTYRKPAANTRALGFLNPNGLGGLLLANSGGELPGNVAEGLTLDTKNKFIFASAVNKPTLKVNTSTGLVTGSIIVPAGKKRIIKGVLLNDNFVPVIQGFASGTTRNVAMMVGP